MRINNSEFSSSIIEGFIESTKIASYIDTAKISPLTMESMIVKYRMKWIGNK